MKFTQRPTWIGVLLPSAAAIFFHRSISTSSEGNCRSSSSNRLCSSGVHGWLNVTGFFSSKARPRTKYYGMM